MFKFDSEKIHSLCGEIDMPGEVTDRLCRIAAERDFSGVEASFNKLLSLETGAEAQKEIVSWLKENERSLEPLAVYLAAALKTRERYQELSIPGEIYTSTMKIFSRFVCEHLETYGFYGFDRDFWIYRILSASLFRLGILEFEIRKCPDDEMLKGYAVKGENLISVHIPSDALMTRENLNQSYQMASLFFKKHLPEYSGAVMYCNSWLLDPGLKNMLPAESRILEFQSDYKITSVRENDNGFMIWVYKKWIADSSLLPENTTLQRNIKKHLLSGGFMSSATGIKNS